MLFNPLAITKNIFLNLPYLRVVLLKKVGIVFGHFLGTMAGHESELLVGDASSNSDFRLLRISPASKNKAQDICVLGLVSRLLPIVGAEILRSFLEYRSAHFDPNNSSRVEVEDDPDTPEIGPSGECLNEIFANAGKEVRRGHRGCGAHA